jgi:hypothetical protein
VAEVLGCPVGTARSLVSRGAARLRTALTESLVLAVADLRGVGVLRIVFERCHADIPCPMPLASRSYSCAT